MGEAKRVPTWGEIHEVEAAVKTICEASAAAARISSIFSLDDDVNPPVLGGAINGNDDAARTLRAWAKAARVLREAADLERKKAGLL